MIQGLAFGNLPYVTYHILCVLDFFLVLTILINVILYTGDNVLFLFFLRLLFLLVYILTFIKIISVLIPYPMMSGSFRYKVWDPPLIISQIITMQVCFLKIQIICRLFATLLLIHVNPYQYCILYFKNLLAAYDCCVIVFYRHCTMLVCVSGLHSWTCSQGTTGLQTVFLITMQVHTCQHIIRILLTLCIWK